MQHKYAKTILASFGICLMLLLSGICTIHGQAEDVNTQPNVPDIKVDQRVEFQSQNLSISFAKPDEISSYGMPTYYYLGKNATITPEIDVEYSFSVEEYESIKSILENSSIKRTITEVKNESDEISGYKVRLSKGKDYEYASNYDAEGFASAEETFFIRVNMYFADGSESSEYELLRGNSNYTSTKQVFLVKCYYHDWDKTTSVIDPEPTALKTGVKTTTCSICNETKEESVAKLTPTITLKYTEYLIGKGQTYESIAVSGLAKDDYVASFTSTKPTVVKVNSKGAIKGKKKGSCYVKIKLASGLTKKVKVVVQNDPVQCSKLKVSKSSVVLRKGESVTITSKAAPITVGYPITYKSSNKAVATVGKTSGKIKAVKAGNCRITVTCGKKKKYISVKIVRGVNNSNPVVSVASTVGNGSDFLAKAKAVSDVIVGDGNWTYGNSGLKCYFELERAQAKRQTSCARFVCYCAQKYGTLNEGMTFYSDGNGKITYETGVVNGSVVYTKDEVKAQLKACYDITKVDSITAEEAYKKGLLKKGDICCWKGHTNIFAGYNSSKKKMYWYDGGRGSVTDNTANSGTFDEMYRASNFGSMKMTYILRVKSSIVGKSRKEVEKLYAK